MGCANGLLMECLIVWAAEDGFEIEPYGLDLNDSLAALARLPHWAKRLVVGNVMDRRSPFRFDIVRTELEYASPQHRQEMVEHLLRDYLVQEGRLIVCSYGSSRRVAPKAGTVAGILRDWGHAVDGEAKGLDTNVVVFTRVAWTHQAEIYYSIVSETTLSPASLSGTQ